MDAGAIADGQPGCGEQTLVALFRLWQRHRGDGVNPLPAMAALATLHGMPADGSVQLAVACDSFLALTEACLDRPLQPGIDAAGSVDERALLVTLRQMPVLEAIGPSLALPHGLPGALQWAAFAVLRWVDVSTDDQPELRVLLACPYAAEGSIEEPAPQL
ncbi:hypothetical protein PK98_04385 [Croceibacterium mercuriale]|uniref:Uncharacterized protein n=1 Tax=Croceibacterium mercuriale TaxID=1572751 RepID=A0A0B2C0Q0_9SPHN|nr:hypothetical protein [Croceibacterium mercuriale]KHL25847.1 hypothetical protein PK98_04385 [Croceibacterium mercuriale]